MDKIALTPGSSLVQQPETAKPTARSNTVSSVKSVQPVEAKNEPEQSDGDVQEARTAKLESFAAKAFDDEDGSRLSIRYHAESGRYIYRELDSETGEVVREYPPEEVLDRLEKNAEIRNEMATDILGLTFDKNL